MYKISGKVKIVNKYGKYENYAQGGWIFPYFRAINDNSSPSKWSKSPFQINQDGSYSFTLEDSTFLTSSGKYEKNRDKVYLAFYWNYNDNTDNNMKSLNLTHTAFIDHLIENKNEVTLNVVLWPIFSPQVIFTFPDIVYGETKKITASEESQIDIKPKECYTCGPQYTIKTIHPYEYDNLKIFEGYKLEKVEYNWGDGEKTVINKKNNKTSSTHTYKIGKTKIEISVYNKFGKSTTAKDILDFQLFETALEKTATGNNTLRRLQLFVDNSIDYDHPYLSFIVDDERSRYFTREIYAIAIKNELKNPYVVRFPLKERIEDDGVKELYCENRKDIEKIFNSK